MPMSVKLDEGFVGSSAERSASERSGRSTSRSSVFITARPENDSASCLYSPWMSCNSAQTSDSRTDVGTSETSPKSMYARYPDLVRSTVFVHRKFHARVVLVR